jgi:hypothetical protein
LGHQAFMNQVHRGDLLDEGPADVLLHLEDPVE